ncbi:MAG: AzlD domain-containing protein [Clostridia bacterium]|nr:AzlD domain-containing protein [Clostridia bacterium]
MNIALLILGMCLVTYIPRVLPAFFADKMNFGKRFEKFIGLIPYTAMTALIVPGILSVDADRWYVGVIGGIVAIALGCIKRIPSSVAVLGSVLSVMAIYLII